MGTKLEEEEEPERTGRWFEGERGCRRGKGKKGEKREGVKRRSRLGKGVGQA